MSILAEAARKLRVRYIEGLPAKRRVVQEALTARSLGDPEADGTLRRIAHQIRGSAASYGLLEIDNAAYRLEYAETTAELEQAAAELIVALHEVYRAESSPYMKILLIDDDPAVGPLLEGLLSEERISLTQVLTAAEGHEELNSGDWSAIFVDLILPDADGRTLLTRIRAAPSHRDTPLIVLSAKTSSLVKNECAMYGIDSYIEKPIDPRTFAVGIASVLGRARSLQAAAYDDSLTGLPNRVGFRRAFEPLRLLAERNGSPLSLALLDIDHFKRFNDDFGHHVGDRALVTAAQTIKASLRHSDLVGRWGGEEFIIGLPETGAKAAVELLGRAARALREHEDFGAQNPMTFSGGVTELEPGETLDFGLLRADQLLYQVKRTGRGKSICELEPVADGRPRLLFAEDDPGVASLIMRDLSEDFEVTHVGDGGEALELSARERFDIVMLDYQMPRRNGIDVVRELRTRPEYRDTPILLLTAIGSDTAVEQAFAAGADDYITKPHRRRALLARLFRHLGRSAVALSDDTPRPVPQTVESMVTVVVCDFVDVEGPGAGLPAKRLRPVLDGYTSLATKILVRRKAEVDKLGGHRLVAVFGAPVLREDDARRALKAAVEIQQAVRQMASVSRPLGVRVGLHSSLVTAASVAGQRYVQEGALDGVVRVAREMATTVSAGAIVLDAKTVEQSSASSSGSLNGPVPWQVEGRSVELYRLRWQ
ncbi:putative diguanylate cyclase YedQ [Enhygromyxa salina]|uniref:diguanylate cyclase n=1 Tax=Enhygromyxa salina TaxID=215803 RepID=A0A2S9YJU4_9BACT|nr:response regulator [Enhygromyxa salina]PRQ05379.1 putative diguanylate cyclase YedQ [Enhygromyxa salina]